MFLKKIFASEVCFSLLHMLGNLSEKLSWAHVLRAPIPFKWYQSTSGCCTENLDAIFNGNPLENDLFIVFILLCCYSLLRF